MRPTVSSGLIPTKCLSARDAAASTAALRHPDAFKPFPGKAYNISISQYGLSSAIYNSNYTGKWTWQSNCAVFSGEYRPGGRELAYLSANPGHSALLARWLGEVGGGRSRELKLVKHHHHLTLTELGRATSAIAPLESGGAMIGKLQPHR
jgi:hypothetical protein